MNLFRPETTFIDKELAFLTKKWSFLIGNDLSGPDTSLEPANQDSKLPHMNRTIDSKASNYEQKEDFD